jgi:hypothetical protein
MNRLGTPLVVLLAGEMNVEMKKAQNKSLLVAVVVFWGCLRCVFVA